MLQYLNSLNPLEYAQYEAFRRSTIRADLVAKFVASCLIQIEEERFSQRANAKDFLVQGHESAKETEARLQIRPLSRLEENSGNTVSNINLDDLVEPGAAPEIAIAVSSLAKAYAQRLIQTSRSIAAAQGHDDHEPLLPSHVLEAYRQRSQAGLDPGFFLQPRFFQERLGSSLPFVRPDSVLLSTMDHTLKPMATLAAQELYDQMISKSVINSTVEDETST
jgi:hypothetical protein